MNDEVNIQTEGLCKEVTTCVINAYEKGYKQGYKRGYKEGEDIEQSNSAITKEEVAKLEYERGLNNAWECARKIWRMTPYERAEIFHDKNCMLEHTASKAIQMIKEYEEKKEMENDIKIGDEIEYECYGKGIVTRICNNILTITWLEDGTSGVIHIHAAKKTGKHYDCIAEIFKNVSKEK